MRLVKPTPRMPQRGFTLIEVLITVFIAGVGLLAVVGLQVMSKKFNYDAIQRTAAGTLAQAMVEKMRGNPGHLAAYLTDDAGATTAAADCAGAAAACTPEELAAHDLHTWGRLLLGDDVVVDGESVGGLVEPTGCITATTTPGLYEVAVAWRGLTALDPPDDDVPDDDPSRHPCGLDSGRYDDPRTSGADDRLRRVLVLHAFVADPYAP